MVGIQKRFVLASIPSAIIFVITYGILDFPILISLLISALAYAGGIFLFKGKDMRMYDPKALAKYQFDLSRLNAYKDNIKDKTIKTRISNIVTICQELTKYLETKPANATNIYNSLDYYLTFATSRVNEYMKIEKIKEKTFTENQLILKLNVYLREIEQECDKLNKAIINSKDKKINYEMKKFERISDFEDDKPEKTKNLEVKK